MADIFIVCFYVDYCGVPIESKRFTTSAIVVLFFAKKLFSPKASFFEVAIGDPSMFSDLFVLDLWTLFKNKEVYAR